MKNLGNYLTNIKIIDYLIRDEYILIFIDQTIKISYKEIVKM